MNDGITLPDKYQWKSVKNQYISAIAGNFPKQKTVEYKNIQ